MRVISHQVQMVAQFCWYSGLLRSRSTRRPRRIEAGSLTNCSISVTFGMRPMMSSVTRRMKV